MPTVLLWQALCEFTAFCARRGHRPGRARPDNPTAFHFVRVIRKSFRLVIPTAACSELAMDIHLTDQVSIWDAMLLAACVDAGVTQLFTEDAQSRPTIRGVRIVNPFA